MNCGGGGGGEEKNEMKCRIEGEKKNLNDGGRENKPDRTIE